MNFLRKWADAERIKSKIGAERFRKAVNFEVTEESLKQYIEKIAEPAGPSETAEEMLRKQEASRKDDEMREKQRLLDIETSRKEAKLRNARSISVNSTMKHISSIATTQVPTSSWWIAIPWLVAITGGSFFYFYGARKRAINEEKSLEELEEYLKQTYGSPAVASAAGDASAESPSRSPVATVPPSSSLGLLDLLSSSSEKEGE